MTRVVKFRGYLVMLSVLFAVVVFIFVYNSVFESKPEKQEETPRMGIEIEWDDVADSVYIKEIEENINNYVLPEYADDLKDIKNEYLLGIQNE